MEMLILNIPVCRDDDGVHLIIIRVEILFIYPCHSCCLVTIHCAAVCCALSATDIYFCRVFV